jgi:hypothetical protein
MKELPIELIDQILNKLNKETLYQIYQIIPDLSWLIIEKIRNKEITLNVKYDDKISITSKGRGPTLYESNLDREDLKLKEFIKLLEDIYEKEGNIRVNQDNQGDALKLCLEIAVDGEMGWMALFFKIQY